MKLGLTLQVVADRAGVSAMLVSHGEIGDRSMRFAYLEAIVTKGFGISLARFFGAVPKYRQPAKLTGRPRKNGKPNAGARA